MAMKIELFVPPEVPERELDLEIIKQLTGKDFYYASKGRHAIGHIIKALDPKNNIVLVSPYMCDSVFKKLESIGMQIEYYDIDAEDLNPNPDSISKKIGETGAAVVIAASLYGNPADMERIESICKEKGVYLIDDAAQSFGAKIGERYIGCFGDAGLWAFSPGKATPAHMGALYWVNKPNTVKRTRHPLTHRIAWLDYKINRQKAYQSSNLKKSMISKMNIVMHKISNIEDDSVERFEERKLGGIFWAQLKGNLEFRKCWYDEFMEQFGNEELFRILKSKRGASVSHKIVLVFRNEVICDDLKKALSNRLISYYSGYDISDIRFDNYEGCRKIRNCIIELPIEDNEKHMQYLLDTIKEWLNKK